MKPLLVGAGIAAAFAGMASLAYISLGPAGEPAPPPPIAEPEPRPEPQRAPPASPELRAYVTHATLREDLRDALADEGVNLDAEAWRVSARLASDPRRVLGETAPGEKSPKVRGLLVLAAGVHAPDDPALHRFFEDRFAVVREAAVLAVAAGEGPARLYLGRVRVPTGRAPSARTRARLERMREGERDERVLQALSAILGR